MATNITNIINNQTGSDNQKDILPQDLAPNNYLTIIWKDVKTNKIINTLDIDDKQALEYTNQLTSSIDNAIRNNNVSYAGQNRYLNLESIGKYLAQNVISAGAKRQVMNALIGLASGAGKKTPDDVVNLCLNVFGTIADKTARKLGLTDPHEIFSQLAGQNVITVLGELGKQVKTYLGDFKKKINKSNKTNEISQDGNKDNPKQYVGLLLGLTTSDTESYEITIPRKKVEKGSDYTTHLLPQPFKKEFNVKLTNKILSSDFSQIREINAIEYTKDKMIEIAQSHTLFDIYIRLSNEKIYKRSNVCFSSLSFTKDEDSGNSYTASFTIEPINEFKTNWFVSTKKYSTKSGSKNTGSKNKGSGNKHSGKGKSKTSNGKSLKYGYGRSEQTFIAKNLEELKKIAGKKYYIIKSDSFPHEYTLISKTQCFRVPDYNKKYVWAIASSTTQGKPRTLVERASAKINKTKNVLKGGYYIKGNSVTNNKGLTYTIIIP